ncbi:Acyltransferase 3 [Vibrio chagasii]|nr:Acyltransferase 3 [Vibrio chagasii]CAH7197506.1 Acyltransferase 3 [Vibrio chagasii]CAH7431185.1 Acyltransferase 3 [Vibrio chagasii]
MYYKELDGLRGMAALNVMVAHFICAFLPSLMGYNYPGIFNVPDNPSTIFTIISSPLVTILYNGHFAVLLFFVLSGFVLTSPYFNDNKLSLKKRVWSRYVRLGIPVAVSIALGFLVVKLGFFYNKEAASLSGSTSWLINFYNDVTYEELFRNMFYKGLILGDGTLNPPLWTLKIEFLGSLLLLTFYIVKPNGYELIYVIIISFFLYLLLGSESIYYMALFAGALINTIESLRFKWLVLLVGVYFSGYQYHSLFYSWLPTFSAVDDKTLYNAIAALFVVTSVKFGCFSCFFKSRFCQFLGKTSFSAYLLHMIVLCSLISYLYVNLVGSTLDLIVLFVGYIFLVYSSSLAYFYLVDKKSVKLSHVISKSIKN